MSLVSLQPKSRITRGLEEIHLRTDELDAIPFLKSRTIIVNSTTAELRGDRRGFLLDHGFERGALNCCQLLDLTPYDSDPPYLETLAPKRRSYLRQALRLFEEVGGVAEIKRLGEANQKEISDFYTDVVIPACSIRSISPFGALYASGYHNLISALDSEVRGYLLSLRVEGRLVAGAIIRVFPVQKWVSESCGKSNGGKIVWDKQLPAEGYVADLKFAHAHPTAEGPKISPRLSTLLYWNAIKWAIGEKINLFSGGLEDRSFIPNDYLGVLYFKKLWGMSTAVFFSETKELHHRIPETLFLGAKRNASIPLFVGEERKCLLRFLLASDPSEDLMRLLLSSDPHLEKEIVVATRRDAVAVENFLKEKGVQGRVRLWNWEL